MSELASEPMSTVHDSVRRRCAESGWAASASEATLLSELASEPMSIVHDSARRRCAESGWAASASEATL